MKGVWQHVPWAAAESLGGFGASGVVGAAPMERNKELIPSNGMAQHGP